MADTPRVSYTITKTRDNGDGSSTYRLTYRLDKSGTSLVQKSRLIVRKEDADGTKSSTSVDIKPSSLASVADANAAEPTAGRTNGFSVNLSDANLAVGGTYYEIDGFVGTYSAPSAGQSGGSDLEGEIIDDSETPIAVDEVD